MWSEIVTTSIFLQRDSWKADIARYSYSISKSFSKKKSACIGDLVKIKKQSAEPSALPDTTPYIGLENIVGNYGALVNIGTIKSNNVRSRSKVCGSNDIIYGRLRPNLNKVSVIPSSIKVALCSTEFLVFEPLEGVPSYFLWSVLSSPLVAQHLSTQTSGTTLPRIKKEKVLAVSIPQEILNQQEVIANESQNILCEIEDLQIKLNEKKENLNAHRDRILV
jgi:type I restriction enzyme S subunit